MQRLNVLISGAGIAGMTLAYWLARRGMDVTVVELAAGQRSRGSPVDVRGQAADIADRMGIMVSGLIGAHLSRPSDKGSHNRGRSRPVSALTLTTRTSAEP